MKLDKPALPISVQKEELLEQIREAIFEKNWREEDIGLSDFALLYVPFFVFNYEAFSESKTEESETPIVAETQNGRMALNAFDSELDEEIAALFEEEELNLEKKTPKEYAFELQKTRLKDEEARQIAQVKMAAQLSLGKGNVIISALELVYVPFWIGSATVGGQEYRLEANAVSGELVGLEELPERGKGVGELTKETIFELKDPVAWVKYSVSIVIDVAKWIWNSAPVKWFVEKITANRQFQVSILICILILIALKEAGYI